MPATVAAVRVFLGVDAARDVDTEALGTAVAAANAVVSLLRPDVTVPEPWPDDDEDADEAPPIVWPSNIEFAAKMYAAQLYGRRGSLFGTLNYQEMAVNMRTVDPHVYALLELGQNQRSVIA